MSLSYHKLPEKPGIYFFKNKDHQVIYIGKANNLKKRVGFYFSNTARGEKILTLVETIKKIEYIVVESEIEALLLEANLIKKYQPKYNVNLKDGKAYPFLKIATSEIYPRITMTRSVENQKDIFFGPYPDVKTLYYLLKKIRRIFPFRSCRKLLKKPCLYFYINQCPGMCFNSSGKLSKNYVKTIKKITLFLEGKSDRVLKILTNEMEENAKKQQFEEAGKIKKQIGKIQAILKPVHQPLDYLKNPNLIDDIRSREINELTTLIKNGLGIKYYVLRKIECYDVSNTSGKEATGSMVVFTGGDPDKSQYRRFKIRFNKKVDDLAMIKEILERRLKHQEWSFPDLIVIDGGKNQVATGMAVLNKFNLKIPLIGLAKRLEEIYLPKESPTDRSQYLVYHLPRSSLSLHLLQRLRDEAHRFALAYHRKLRGKMII